MDQKIRNSESRVKLACTFLRPVDSDETERPSRDGFRQRQIQQ